MCIDLPFYSAKHYSNERSEMEGYCTRLQEKSTATVFICAFSYMSFPHAYCCYFRRSMDFLVCVCITHLYHIEAAVV